MSTSKILQNLGIDEETINSITDENLAEVEGKLIEAVKGKLLEDENFYASVDKSKLPKEWFKEQFDQGAQKFTMQSKSSIDKHFGLTTDDKSKFSEEEKKDVDKYVAKATSLYKEKLASSNPDVSGLQDENIGLKKRLSELEEQQKTLSEKFDSELKEKLTAKEMETLSLIEASGLQPNVPISINLIWDKIYASVKDKYAVVIDAGSVSIRKKDKPSFKVDHPEKKGSHLSLRDAIALELKAFGAWKEGNEPQSKGSTTTVQVTPNNKGYFSDAIAKKIAEEEAMYGNK